jgi:hypothetical protein
MSDCRADQGFVPTGAHFQVLEKHRKRPRAHVLRARAESSGSGCSASLCVFRRAILTPVPVGNSRSDILVVQPTQDGDGQRLTDGLDGAGDRRVLLQ